MLKRIILTMFVAGSLATAWALALELEEQASSTANLPGVFPATTSAPTAPLDAATTVLPCYELPAGSVADGNLEKWKGVPPAVSAEWFKHNESNALITPCDDFSPAMYLGRIKDTDDLMVLIVIQGRCVFGYESAAWTFGDNVEIFIDLYRQARLEADPGITTQPARYQNHDATKPYNSHAAYAQVGLLPRTPLGPGKMLHSRTYGRASSVNWNITYASMPVSGGVAYELKIDGQAALKAVGLDALPDIISIEPVIQAVDYPLLLEAGAWKNHRGYFRTFGDYTTLAYPLRNGAVNTKPLPPQGDKLPGVTLAAKFGSTPEEIKKHLASLYDPATRIVTSQVWPGELFYWASCNGIKLDKNDLFLFLLTSEDEPIPDHRLAHEANANTQRQRELSIQAMLSPSQDADVRSAVAEAIIARAQQNTHRALVTACLIAAELKSGDPDHLVALLGHEDMTVAISAARALVEVGKKEHAVAFRKLYDEKLAALAASKKPDDRAMLSATRVFLQPPLELLEFRVDPPAEPKSVLQREILQENTDLTRLMPIDNNHVYNGKLARTWPAGGPKELWRQSIGIEGVMATAVEAGGKTFVMGGEFVETPAAEGQAATSAYIQFGYCFNAADGTPLWKKPIGKGRPTYGTAGSPIIDGDRVYFFPGATVCLSVADGSEVWRSDVFRSPTFPSALLVGDVLYIPGKSLWAVNKMNGELLWTSPPDPADRRDHSLASPGYTEIDGVPVIVTGFGSGGHSELVGLNPKNGEVFFSKALQASWGLCSSPVIAGSRLYVCCGQMGQEFFACYQLFAKDGKVLATPVFTRPDRQSNYSATLAVWEGAVYGFGNAGLECCDAATGDLLWSEKSLGGLEIASHVLLADGLLLIRSGTTIVLAEANKTEYRERGRFEVPFKLAAQQHTLANGRLYIRGEETLIVYDVGAE